MDDQLGELSAYYRLCRYLGIFCIDYIPTKKRFLLRRSLICYVVHLALQAYLVGCMVVMVLFWRKCFKSELTKTGNHFDRLVMVIALGILVVQNAWLIWLQAPHLRIVRRIELYRRKHLGHVQLLLPKRLLWLIVVTNLIYVGNFIKTCVLEWLSDAPRLFVVTSLGFPLRYLVTSLTMGTYFCMVHILRLVLSWNQSQITAIVDQSGDRKKGSALSLRLRGCLELHDRVVLLCNDEISLVYGFIVWLSWVFASLDVTGVIYLTMVIQSDRSPVLKCVTNIVWLSPTLMTCAASFISNRVSIQANKTAKILAKVPRTGTGLDRMIDKFLLKNLRQQPILTAFGFFALDKSTLFKLFTAIFTYMVILVQFKEMENSTKAIGKV
ncbi:gustatory and pheromone receptor 39a-like isoform X1 [Drosophila ficusphila]|uniref:gustatory and pheromone receptor 39a-like isoform X1 n=1 Tax=Drosophila ficusphila TaxID=30025 RepID=UPI0007E7BE24|nr:gustatory and pheromone receptor 39a-like isoform X1 [Drosophila ficusphila]